MSTTEVDVCIVGAGVSGVYAAWRLATSPAYADQTIAVYELSDRIGGRLLSARPPGMPNVAVELGGMRFFSTQKLVADLVNRELHLPVVELPADLPENLAFFRGRRHRRADLTKPASSADLGYTLDWSESGVAPADLFTHAIGLIVPGFDAGADEKTTRAQLAAATVDGRGLRDWGFWNLLARVLSHEAYQLLKATVGYDSTFTNWNALESILENLDFDPSVRKYRLVGGYDEVPQTLADRFVGAGGRIEFDHRLRHFDVVSGDDHPVVASFEHGPAASPVEVRAKRLVLAMPRTSLEGIERRGAVLDRRNADVHDLIRTVAPDPLVKVGLAYDRPWWETVGVSAGRSLSDQPIRQAYYWGVEREQPGGDPANGNAALLVYNDAESIDFFTAYLQGPSDPYPLHDNPWTANAPGSAGWNANPAPRALVAEVHRQLLELHGMRGVPEPYAAAAVAWAGYPFGGGANFWLPHTDPTELIPRVATPVPDLPVHIIGEAYSNGQSWVEGALQTAELVLQERFGLDAPGWVSGT